MLATSVSKSIIERMSSSNAQPHGFDAAVTRRDDDHLNRWPLAREIYGIATTGPRDWSVRIGIYGEWGTGKTSVLEFITAMAKHDGQTVVRFNPWQHSSKDALWLAFVTAIYSQPIFYSMERAGWIRTKKKFRWLLGKGEIAEGGAAVFNETAGKAVGVGLDIVKGWFSFTEDDLKAIRSKLGDKRVIVLIDDLDRTAPELVPEILFALKELMNIPGFAFICAFDPVVVGQVLGDFHPGFGDGLKFLEKIIDYPRWLPPPPPRGLAKLAIADAKQYCDYVPEAELRDAIELLPQNPRSVRQFIRLLKLLGPQIKRHDDDELRWPAILAANVIKVNYPRLAHALLNDIEFWRGIEGVAIMDRGEEKEKLTGEIEKQVKAVDVSLNTKLDDAEKAEIVRAMMPLCSNIALWFGGGAEVQVYQMNIAESPHAVTGKEFKEFCVEWDREPSAKNAKAWITDHANQVERLPIEVYRELLSTALDRYLKTVRQPDNVLLAEERLPILTRTQALISMIECLVLELGQIDTPDKLIGSDEIEMIFESFATNLRSYSGKTDDFCTRNEKLLNEIITRWQGDASPLVDAILPYGHWGSRRFDGPNAFALHQRLSAAILPRLAAQVIAGFRQPNFVQRIWTQDKGTAQIRCVLLAHDGPLWKDARKELLVAIQDAGGNQTIQDNVYDLLYWFDHGFSERAGTGDAESLKQLFQDKELLAALWAAATARPLSPYSTIKLNKFVQSLKKIEITVALPTWWEYTIKQIELPKAVNQPPENETDQTA
jgi:hypothetical protein